MGISDGKGRGAWNDYAHYAATAQNQKNYGRAADSVNFFLGGPVGWGKAATGWGGLGGNFGEHRADAGLSEEDFNLMTDEEHDAYENLNQNQRAIFLEKMRKKRQTEGAEGKKRKAAEDELAKKKADREAAQALLLKKIQAFADEMNMPVDQLLQRDDYAKMLQANTQTAAMTGAMGRGIGPGGISTANADYASKRALLGYQQQRQDRGQQAMAGAYGMLANEGIQAEGIRRYEQGLDLQMQQAQAAQQYQKYMQGMNKEAGMWGLAGGALGAFVGGPTGAAAGQQLGSSVGGMQYQNNNPFKGYEFKYPSGSGTSGGGYGGNY